MTFLENVNELSSYLAANVQTVFDLEKLVVSKTIELMPDCAVYDLYFSNMRYDGATNTLRGGANISAEVSLSRYLPSIIVMNGSAEYAYVEIDCSHYPLLEQAIKSVSYSLLRRDEDVNDLMISMMNHDMKLHNILSRYSELKTEIEFVKSSYLQLVQTAMHEVEIRVNERFNTLVHAYDDIGLSLKLANELFEIPTINAALKKSKL